MDILSSLLAIGLAALIHGGFQLSVSVLTLLSGHAISAKRSQAKLLRLTTGFVIGAGTMTLLLLSFVCLLIIHTLNPEHLSAWWTATIGATIAVSLAIWFFYYRKEKGTTLWIPRGLAKHLTERAKQTSRSAESFGLGLVTVFMEILFIATPILISALLIVQLPAIWQLAGLAIYTLLSLTSLGVVWAIIGSGHNISRIQRWRERNKRFLQFVASAGLIVLAMYVYVDQVVAVQGVAL
jgi:hypothetical protein